MADLASDLKLIGLTLVAHGERCRSGCAMCLALDRQFDVDALAVGPHGRPCFISWRDQDGEYDYRTITIRWANDKGNEDVQARKIVDGRSKADVFVQSYASGVAYSLAAPIRVALSVDVECGVHPRRRTGRDGQVLRILCPDCVPSIAYVPRATVTLATESMADEFDDPAFVARWTSA